MKTIVHAVGARPNFVKLAPVFDGLAELGGFRQVLVHTGQHYDPRLSDLVLDDLGLPAPDRHLGVGSGTHAEQTGRIMVAFEPVLLEESPDLVVVAGDVNSTVACALTAAKLGIPVAHVESGLRSFDWSMPEELNRVLTDRISTLLFTHSPEAAENLSREGVDPTRIHYVGNTMIDSLVRLIGAARERAAWDALGLEPGAYLLVTLHRPSNVDEPGRLAAIVDALVELGARRQGRVPPPPAHRRRSRPSRPARAARNDSPRARAAQIPRLPLAGDGCARSADGLRWRPGGNRCPGNPLLHVPSQHGAADHDRGRH